MKLRFVLILCLIGTGAVAQAPSNVNDCTLLPDPIALKRCVDNFGPQSLKTSNVLPLPPVPSVAAQPAPGPKGALKPLRDAPSDAWLHDGQATGRPRRLNSDAIQLNE